MTPGFWCEDLVDSGPTIDNNKQRRTYMFGKRK